MKTSSRHSPTSGFSRHLRETRLFRKLLKAHHAATYDAPASPNAAPAYCAARFDLSYTGKKKEEQLIPDIQITPPPPSYHEIPSSAPAVREVSRFKPIINEPKPNQRAAHSVATLNITALPNALTLPLDEFSTPSLEPSSFEDMALSSAPTFRPHTTPLRHHRSADNLRQSSLTTLTRASPLGSHPVQNTATEYSVSKEQPPAVRPRRPTQPPLLRRASSYPLIPVAIMSPIREEEPPHSPRPRAATFPSDSHSAKRATHRPPISILRHAPSSAPHRQREQKHVHFDPSALPEEEEDGPAVAPVQKEQLVLFSAAVMVASMLLVLAFADVFDSAHAFAQMLRPEYVVAFVVGCGVAHWLSGVAEIVGGTLGRAREEGWV